MESRRVVAASIFVTGWQQKHCYKVTAETHGHKVTAETLYRVTVNTNTFTGGGHQKHSQRTAPEKQGDN